MEYKVKTGDSVASIAETFGLFPDTIWEHPSNIKLKKTREDPNMLVKGDVLHVPEKEQSFENCKTEQMHRFRRKGVPAKISFRIIEEDGTPRKGIEYIICIDGHLHQGYTDDNGSIEYSIPPNAKKAELQIEGETYEMLIGGMDPIDTTTGIQARLVNLGFNCGKVDGSLESKTKESLLMFQEKHNLEMTGEIDDPTKQKLYELHGS